MPVVRGWEIRVDFHAVVYTRWKDERGSLFGPRHRAARASVILTGYPIPIDAQLINPRSKVNTHMIGVGESLQRAHLFMMNHVLGAGVV